MIDKIISKTYQEVAQEYFEKQQNSFFDIPQTKEIVLAFAKYLDSFQVLTDQLQILAMQKSREIDGKVLHAMADALGKEKTEEIIREIYKEHRHTKTPRDVEYTDIKSDAKEINGEQTQEKTAQASEAGS